MKRRGRQTDLSTALESVSRSLDRKSGGAFLQVRVADEWERVAGASVASHTTGAHLRAGELVVDVDSSVWATELTALAGPYLTAMNEALGRNLVRSVRFTVSRKVTEKRARIESEQRAQDFYRPDPTEPIPLSAEERASVEASVPDVGDDELRQAAIRATVAGLEWEKGRRARKSAQKPPHGL